ncbi:MAG: hypothetical protein AAGK14_00905 [Verrucomicrobiota bacterium]
MRIPLRFAAAVLALNWALPATAQLGISPQEAAKKYGAPQGEIKPVPGADFAAQYAKGNRLYNLHFQENSLVLAQINGQRTPLTPGIANNIRLQFARGTRWLKDRSGQPRWTTIDGRAVAEYDPERGELFVFSTQWQKAQTLGSMQEAEAVSGQSAPGAQTGSEASGPSEGNPVQREAR